MIGHALIVFCLAIGQSSSTSSATPQSTSPTTTTQAPSAAKGEPDSEVDKGKSLSKVRRIYVEEFGADPIAQQMQAMVISSLTESKRFTVTEDKSKADAILKGTATEKRSQELHSYGSGTAVGTAGGTVRGAFGAAGAALQDSSTNTETIESAHAAVRLVSANGDVIWTTTQESGGGKFKGASADVADKIAKQLVRDAEKADRLADDSQKR